jgi:hypothetical protein
VCCTIRTKGKSQDNQDKDVRRKKNPAGGMDVFVVCFTLKAQATTIKTRRNEYERKQKEREREGIQEKLPDGVWNFSSHLILLSALSSPGVHSVFNRNEYQGTFLGVKAAGA